MKIQLTIADYLAMSRRGADVPSRHVSSNSVPEPFERVMKIKMPVPSDSHPEKKGTGVGRGMNLRDYLNNPVRNTHAAGFSSLLQVCSSVEENRLQTDGYKDPGSENPEKNPSSISYKDRQAAENIADFSTGSRTSARLDLRQKIDACIEDVCRIHDVSPDLIRGIIRAESDFQPHAISSAGAQGLMQLMPGTARELGVTDPFDIRENIDGGVRYFKKMLLQFEGDIELSLAAYNAGPGNVRRYNGVPPFRETLAYIEKIRRFTGFS